MLKNNNIAVILKNLNDKGFFHLYSANILIMISSFGLQLFVAKYLTLQELADIKIVQSYFVFLNIIAVFGCNTAILMICPPIESEKSSINVLLICLKSVCIWLVVMLAMACFYNYNNNEKESYYLWFYIYALSIPFVAYNSIIISYFQARRKIKELSLVQLSSKILAIIVGILMTYLFGAIGFVWSIVFGSCLSSILFWFKQSKYFMSSSRAPFFKDESLSIKFNVILRYSFVAMIANLLGKFNNHFDMLFLDWYSFDKNLVGSYAFASICYMGLNQFTVTVQSIATPYLSRCATTNPDEFYSKLFKYQKYLFTSCCILTVLSLAIFPYFVNIFYGDKFLGSEKFFNMLALKYVIFNISSLFGVGFIALGRFDLNVIHGLIAVFVALCAAPYFLNTWGVYGMAICQVVIQLVVVVLICFLMFRHKKGA